VSEEYGEIVYDLGWSDLRCLGQGPRAKTLAPWTMMSITLRYIVLTLREMGIIASLVLALVPKKILIKKNSPVRAWHLSQYSYGANFDYEHHSDIHLNKDAMRFHGTMEG
jgi:hypothetical protein